MRPNYKLLLLIGAWTLVAIASSHGLVSDFIWISSGALIGIYSAINLAYLLRLSIPTAERKINTTLPVGVRSTVFLTISNTSSQSISLRINDHASQELNLEGDIIEQFIPAKHACKVNYNINPAARGNMSFSKIEMLITTKLSVLSIKRVIDLPLAVRVYPNFAEITKYTLLATDNNISQMGIKKRQRRGEGMEFHQLREYRQGDSLRQLDWKATSRINKLISKEYQDERDQQLVFLIDCSQRMRSKDGEISHFDNALNSLLLLSYVALKQGDAVGFQTINGVRRSLSPRKSISSIKNILNASYDLEPTLSPPDYISAATDYLKTQKKRSLVILITNACSEDTQDLLTAIKMLKKNNLVLIANLKEECLENTFDTEIKDFDQALTYASAHDYMFHRNKEFAAIRSTGIQFIDVIPQKMPTAIVNRYLDIKTSAQL